MDRKQFLKLTGLTGAASVLPVSFLRSEAGAVGISSVTSPSSSAACALIPSETAGPYPLNLSGDSSKFRRDIRESQAGVLLSVKLRIVGVANCGPIQNARVDLWHCNVNGNYSGFTTNGHTGGQQNFQGQTWLRGIQMTDADGVVEFTTIFPGWYSGRISHIHFQVYLSSVLQVTSQFTFPVEAKNAIYTQVSPYSTWGADPIVASQDNVFSDGTSRQVATLTSDGAGGYESYLEVAINASGSTGLLKMEPETGGQFKLGQNSPNPYSKRITVPFSLASPSDVRLELWNVRGKKVAQIVREGMAPGNQELAVDFAALGIPVENYVYQFEVSNRNGVFRQCKLMTAR